MQPDILKQYLNRYLKSYNSSYTAHHVKRAWLPQGEYSIGYHLIELEV